MVVAAGSTTVSGDVGVVVVVVVLRSIVDSTVPSGIVAILPVAGSSSGGGESSSAGAAVSGPMTGTSARNPAAAATVTPIRARPAGYDRRRPARWLLARCTGSTATSVGDAISGAGSSTAAPVGGSRPAVGAAIADSGRRACSAASRSSMIGSFTTPPIHSRTH